MPATNFLKTKKTFAPTWDKSLCFCDTTQIDILRCPLAFTHHHAYPTDNGRVPVGPYLGEAPVQAALGRPFTRLRIAPITPPEALLGCPVSALLFFLTGFSFEIKRIIAAFSAVVKTIFKKTFTENAIRLTSPFVRWYNSGNDVFGEDTP